MQEDKEAVFDAFDTTAGSLEVTTIVLQNLSLSRERMRAAATKGMMNATELADYLVRKGVPFREAHEVVGKVVLKAIEKGGELDDLSLDDLRALSNKIEDDVFECLTLEQTLRTKAQVGGTAPDQVAEALANARRLL
jgi:argininosuccinate lyase